MIKQAFKDEFGKSVGLKKNLKEALYDTVPPLRIFDPPKHIKDKMEPVVRAVRNKVRPVTKAIGEKYDSLEKAVQRRVEPAVESIKTKVQPGTKAVGNFVDRSKNRMSSVFKKKETKEEGGGIDSEASRESDLFL